MYPISWRGSNLNPCHPGLALASDPPGIVVDDEGSLAPPPTLEILNQQVWGGPRKATGLAC